MSKCHWLFRLPWWGSHSMDAVYVLKGDKAAIHRRLPPLQNQQDAWLWWLTHKPIGHVPTGTYINLAGRHPWSAIRALCRSFQMDEPWQNTKWHSHRSFHHRTHHDELWDTVPAKASGPLTRAAGNYSEKKYLQGGNKPPLFDIDLHFFI